MSQDAWPARLPHADHRDAVRDGEGRGAADLHQAVLQHDGVHRPVVLVACGFAPRPLHARSRRIQAELGAQHSFREAGRLLSKLLPCSPVNHVTIPNRTHRVAAEIGASSNADQAGSLSRKEEMMMIDGAHIRAVPGHRRRHLDVTVGKVEVAGRKTRRFAFAPKGADRPTTFCAARAAQGWRPGQRDRPVSTSRAEGWVDEIANARMSKRQRMRWSPRGVHRVAVVRAAVLNARLGANSCNQTAA